MNVIYYEPKYQINSFKATVEVAYNLKDLLDMLDIKSYVKTSGKTGLHIFVSIKNSYSYNQTRKFAQAIGNILVKRFPQKITMEWDTRKRRGKVFLDHNQNAIGKTVASIFSAFFQYHVAISAGNLEEIRLDDWTHKSESFLL
jgi:bifunctional non-homologous end joining protein LigD